MSIPAPGFPAPAPGSSKFITFQNVAIDDTVTPPVTTISASAPVPLGTAFNLGVGFTFIPEGDPILNALGQPTGAFAPAGGVFALSADQSLIDLGDDVTTLQTDVTDLQTEVAELQAGTAIQNSYIKAPLTADSGLVTVTDASGIDQFVIPFSAASAPATLINNIDQAGNGASPTVAGAYRVQARAQLDLPAGAPVTNVSMILQSVSDDGTGLLTFTPLERIQVIGAPFSEYYVIDALIEADPALTYVATVTAEDQTGTPVAGITAQGIEDGFPQSVFEMHGLGAPI